MTTRPYKELIVNALTGLKETAVGLAASVALIFADLDIAAAIGLAGVVGAYLVSQALVARKQIEADAFFASRVAQAQSAAIYRQMVGDAEPTPPPYTYTDNTIPFPSGSDLNGNPENG